MSGDDDYEIPETGAVFTFGRSRFAENLSSHFFVRNDPVEEISCGDEHTALVCKSGRVFLFGRNDYGQLGFGHNRIVSKPSCLKYLKPFHALHVACGKGHTIVSTACNQIFTFGCNSDGQLGTGDLNDKTVPQAVSVDLSEGDDISAVGAGCHHSAILTKKGDVYLWGSNSDGQCGAEEPYLTAPYKLQFDQPVTAISCGYYHTAFISLGRTYTFGEEDNGKLGRSRKSSNNEPEVTNIDNCVLVSCGGSHTMVLTDDGVVYAFGSNFSGQLGIGSSDAECSTPKRVEFLDKNVKISHISCGESHSAFLTEQGALYTCGDSRYGKLCNEDDSVNYMTPTFIEYFETYFCTFVSCGGCHTMVLAKIRPALNQPDIHFVQKNKEILPPVKTNQSVHMFPNDGNELDIAKETNTREIQNNGEDNDDFDGKSNTESNLINEEVLSHLDEIYTEIEETVAKNEPTVVVNSKDTNTLNESFETDTIMSTKRGVGKFLNVFKRKKSATAIIWNQHKREAEEEERANDSLKTVNQTQSKTCVLL